MLSGFDSHPGYSCYITKKKGSNFHYYVKKSDLSFVISKDDAKKYNFGVNTTLHF